MPGESGVVSESGRSVLTWASNNGGAEGECFRPAAGRWQALAIYSFLALVNNALWLSFSPAPDAISRRYGVSKDALSVLSAVASLMYVPGSWINERLLNTTGLRNAVLVGCAMQTIGTIVRLLADLLLRPLSGHFAWVVIFVFHTLAMLASPIFMNSVTLLATSWFGDQDRDAAIGVGMLCPIFGQGVGGAVAGFVVTGAEGQGTMQLLLGQAVLSVALAVWAWKRFYATPPRPPSRMAVTLADQAEPTRADWLQVLKFPQFLPILCIISSGASLSGAVLSFYGQLSSRCGYSGTFAGAASGLYMLAGAIGSTASGFLLGATGAYATILRCTVFLSFFSGVIFVTVGLQVNRAALLLVTTACLGLCILAAYPAGATIAARDTFPIPPQVSTSILLLGAQLMLFLYTLVFQVIVDKEGEECGNALSPSRLAILGTALLCCLVPAVMYRDRVAAPAAPAGEEPPLAHHAANHGG